MMMKKYLLPILLIAFINYLAVENCMAQEKIESEAIQRAIHDFSRTSKLFKKETIFYISTRANNGNIIAVSIGKNNMKILIKEDVKVGSTGKIPSRYFEIDGRLFIWWDDSFPLTEDALLIFDKYDLLQNDEGGTLLLPDFEIDDAQKGVDYYFCINDLSKYKKVVTKIGIGYYKPPKLKCSTSN